MSNAAVEPPVRGLPLPGERRGQPRPYVSYWAERRRTQRAAIFQLREQGQTVRRIAETLAVDVHVVEVTLLSDQRARQPR